MTVTNEPSFTNAVGNGVVVEFPFDFKARNAAEVKVGYVVDSIIVPASTLDYSVALNLSGEGGDVTFNIAPANGTKIYIYRETPITQLVSVSAQTGYNPTVVGGVWDKLTMITQEVKAEVDRSLKVAPGGSATVPDELFAQVIAAAESLIQKTHIILATGQSNIEQHPAYVWAPADNCFLWNYDGLTQAPTDVGTAFAAMDNSSIGYAYAYAHQVALHNPDWNVYLINVGDGGQPISKWMTGGPSPDLYACVKNNIEAALTALGALTIDEFVWWQGESDSGSSTYAENFETVHARFRTESWFRWSTPILMSTFSRNYGSGALAPINSVIKQLVRAEPSTRSLVDIGSVFSDQFWWLSPDYVHLSGAGYAEAGRLAYNTRSRGLGNLEASQWRTIVKHAATSRSSTTTLANDPHLKFPMKSGRSYIVRGRIKGNAAAAPDFKWSLVGPTATVSTAFARIMKNDTIATIVGDTQAGAYFTAKTVLQGSQGNFDIEFEQLVTEVASNGTFAFQWAQLVSDAGTTLVWPGSYIEYIEFG